ncbi:DsbA family protein [Thalassobius sp. MITS945101]|uniref:DsbA family protein n=1 Tax=Thalassobius sp. MITS945101 TaxID=3096994 RepID=UPI00399A1520
MNRRYAMGLMGAAAVTAGAYTLFPGQNQLPDLVGMAHAQDADLSGIVEMTMGSEDAPVTLMEYASFTCPHCATFHNNVLGKIKAEYVDTGKVKFVYRDVYFDRPGLWAAMMARCEPTKFFGIADMLYAEQKSWIGGGNLSEIDQNLRRIGLVAGIGKEELDACMSDAENAQALYTWFQQNMESDDVSSTPTLFVDGKKYSNMSYTDLKAILDERLGM